MIKRAQKNKVENFWQNLPRPFFSLAPMLDVTDIAFRQMFVKYSRRGVDSNPPHVFFTEFTSADGLCSEEGREHLLPMLKFYPNERPIVAQLFSANSEHMYDAAKLCAELGFDGIDINMGCPDKNIVKQGAGAGLIKNPALAKEIIFSAHEGAPKLPISVKTRTGFSRSELETWIPSLIETPISALTLHARTQKQLSLVDADWEAVRRMVEIVKESGKEIITIGNGDVASMAEAREKAEKYNCDGIMIGRGIYGNPWFFDESKTEITQEEKLKALLEHIELFEKGCGHKNFAVMKKHFKAYINGFSGAKELRIKLMEADSAEEVRRLFAPLV